MNVSQHLLDVTLCNSYLCPYIIAMLGCLLLESRLKCVLLILVQLHLLIQFFEYSGCLNIFLKLHFWIKMERTWPATNWNRQPFLCTALGELIRNRQQKLTVLGHLTWALALYLSTGVYNSCKALWWQSSYR